MAASIISAAPIVRVVFNIDSEVALAVFVDQVAILRIERSESVGGISFCEVDCEVANMFALDRACRTLMLEHARNEVGEEHFDWVR